MQLQWKSYFQLVQTQNYASYAIDVLIHVLLKPFFSKIQEDIIRSLEILELDVEINIKLWSILYISY